MSVFQYDLKIYQGSTFNPTFTWKSGGAPVDLSGCSARMHVRAQIGDPDPPLITLTSGAGITLGGALGTITLLISAAATAALTWGSAVYDLEIVFPDTTVQRKMEGAVTVSPEVTR